MLAAVVLTKYAEFANSIAVHTRVSAIENAQADTQRISVYYLGVKDDGASSVDLSPFYGKGLFTSISLNSLPGHDADDDMYPPFGWVFNADGNLKNYMYLSKNALANSDSNFSKGWYTRDYTWSLEGKQVKVKGCYISSGSCIRTYVRYFDILRVTDKRVYFVMKAFTHEDGDIYKPISEMSYFTNYMGYLEVYDYDDVDGDGYDNTEDAYPFDSLAQ